MLVAYASQSTHQPANEPTNQQTAAAARLGPAAARLGHNIMTMTVHVCMYECTVCLYACMPALPHDDGREMTVRPVLVVQPKKNRQSNATSATQQTQTRQTSFSNQTAARRFHPPRWTYHLTCRGVHSATYRCRVRRWVCVRSLASRTKNEQFSQRVFFLHSPTFSKAYSVGPSFSWLVAR